MANYPNTPIPNRSAITNITDGVTPRNAQSIYNGVTEQIWQIMNYVNADTLGSSGTPIANGYVTTLNDLNDINNSGSFTVTPNSGYNIEMSSISEGGGGYEEFRLSTDSGAFAFMDDVRVAGVFSTDTTTYFVNNQYVLTPSALLLNSANIQLNAGSIGVIAGNIVATNGSITAGNDVNVGDDLIVGGTIYNGAIKHTHTYQETTPLAVDSDHCVVSTSSSGTSAKVANLPQMTADALGQRYVFYCGYSNTYKINTHANDTFTSVGVAAARTTCDLTERGFIEIVGVRNVPHCLSGYGWLVLNSNGETFSA